ncbi:MAG: hypothetical protein PHE83_15310 [Opitutaceae bacterium]|nr:hypothetical protein [Opitutaceae bacterium]
MTAITVTGASSQLSRRASVQEAAVLLVVAAVIPLLVHLLPSWDTAPLGVHLLPMFWMTFVAAYLHGARLGALAGLVAPLVNLLLTGLPAARAFSALTVELVAFALLAAWATRRFPRFWLVAPLSYAGARLVSILLQAGLTFGGFGTVPALLLRSLVAGLAGLGLLALINAALVKLYARR